MTSPSQSVKVKEKVVQKKVAAQPREKKNIFQHMSDAMGMQTVKLAKGQIPLLEKVKKIIIGLSVYMVLGFIVGMILDMFLQSPYSLANICALVMFLVWILRKGRSYLR
jgi:hypothetical protein